MTTPDHAAALPRLHTYAEAAEILRIEESWLRQHIKQLPRVKLGGRVFFTDADLWRIIELHHHEPEQAAGPAPSGSPIPAGPHPLADLKPRRSRVRRPS